MNNTLNPCSCNASSGGGNASDVKYDGQSVDCLPGLVGQSLAVVAKRIGDLACTGGGGVTATLRNSFGFGTTSANLDSAYPDAKVGDMVYSETNLMLWTKLDTGKWTRTSLDIA